MSVMGREELLYVGENLSSALIRKPLFLEIGLLRKILESFEKLEHHDCVANLLELISVG